MPSFLLQEVWYYSTANHNSGMWLSLVERCVRDAEVAGSNPVIPTITTTEGYPEKGTVLFC